MDQIRKWLAHARNQPYMEVNAAFMEHDEPSAPSAPSAPYDTNSVTNLPPDNLIDCGSKILRNHLPPLTNGSGFACVARAMNLDATTVYSLVRDIGGMDAHNQDINLLEIGGLADLLSIQIRITSPYKDEKVFGRSEVVVKLWLDDRYRLVE